MNVVKLFTGIKMDFVSLCVAFGDLPRADVAPAIHLLTVCENHCERVQELYEDFVCHLNVCVKHSIRYDNNYERVVNIRTRLGKAVAEVDAAYPQLVVYVRTLPTAQAYLDVIYKNFQKFVSSALYLSVLLEQTTPNVDAAWAPEDAEPVLLVHVRSLQTQLIKNIDWDTFSIRQLCQ